MSARPPGRPRGGPWWPALVHLRLTFSLVLTPLYLWGVLLAGGAHGAWSRVALAYLVVHGLLYGGMNAFNSYWDRDEGPIGALAAPPPVDRRVLVVGVGAKVAALAASFAFGPLFAGLVAAAVALSTVYSHPRWRWKERPAHAAATIFVGQGVLGVLWGWAAASGARSAAALAGLGPPGWLGVAGAALWTLGFYPLTGAYQVAGDAARGVRTLAVALGVEGSFRFAATVGLAGGLVVGAVLLLRGEAAAAFAAGAYLACAAGYAWRWRARFAGGTARDNQRALMRLAYANGAFFSLLFGVLAALARP